MSYRTQPKRETELKRDLIVELLNQDTVGGVMERKTRVAEKLGISYRRLNMILNRTQHSTRAKESKARQQAQTERIAQETRTGYRPNARK